VEVKVIPKIAILIIAFMMVGTGLLSGCTETSQEDRDQQYQNNQNGNQQSGPTTSRDTDRDGYNDNIDVFPNDPNEWKDSDKDGYGDNSDAFPLDSSEWKDSDYDGHGDNSDAFPRDSSEWVDSDGDGVGDNSDPYPYDFDNDGYTDSVDIKKNGDAAIKISLKQFKVLDELDFLFVSVEVYFEVYINGRMEARIDNNGASWRATVGETYSINDWVVYNINDDQRYTNVKIIMWDDDYIFESDKIDLDGTDTSSKIFEVVFDAVTGTWSGDDNDGYTDGSDDGSASYDDDDGSLWYDIQLVDVEYDKTYSWTFDWQQWDLHINIPRESYSYYKHETVDRSPYTTSQMAAFVTSDDSIVKKIAQELQSRSNNEGYDYYKTVNFVLEFVHSLEYAYDNASTPMNEYWRFSVETLVDETGDCEDTSILFASIMEAIGYDAVLVNLPGHMAVGISGEGYSGTYYNYDGKQYYYCETTGPGWTMGDIPTNFKGQSATIIQVE
jgi:hypothetical protein